MPSIVRFVAPTRRPNLAHGAIEEVREMASLKVIDAIPAQLAEFRDEMDTRFRGIEVRKRQNEDAFR